MYCRRPGRKTAENGRELIDGRICGDSGRKVGKDGWKLKCLIRGDQEAKLAKACEIIRRIAV